MQKGGPPGEDPPRPILHLQRALHLPGTKRPALHDHNSYIRYTTGRSDWGRALDSRYNLRESNDGLGASGVVRRPATVEFVSYSNPTWVEHPLTIDRLSIRQERIPQDSQGAPLILPRRLGPRVRRYRSLVLESTPQFRSRASYLGCAISMGLLDFRSDVQLDFPWSNLLSVPFPSLDVVH